MSRVGTVVVLYVGLAIALTAGPARALTSVDQAEKDAAIDQRLGDTIDLTVPFTSSSGEQRALRDFTAPGRPTIIVPVYFTCPRLCSLTQGGVAALINSLSLTLGRDYKVLSVSFRSDDTREEAAEKATKFRGQLGSQLDPHGWEFLTGDEASVTHLMSQLGFHFARDGDDMTHAATIIVITPEGMVSRYFFGIEYPERDVRYALVDASAGKIGTLADHLFLFCFRFDPTKGKYTLIIWNVTRAICGTVVVLLATLLIMLRVGERRAARNRGGQIPGSEPSLSPLSVEVKNRVQM